MKYYRISSGCELWHPNGTLLGSGGDVVALETDSKDKKTRKGALAVLSGNWSIVSEVAKPATKKKASKKGASYKTTEATPES